MTALRAVVHEYRCGRIFAHLRARLTTCVGQSLLGIVNDEFLAKGIDETLGASGDDKLIWIDGREADSVAQYVAPQATRCGYDHGIVSSLLYAPQRNDGRIVGSELIHRYELIEHAIVRHEQHRLVLRIALYAKKAFTGIICFHIVHQGRRYELLVLAAVGREGHSAVEEYFQIGPHFLKMLFARQLHHTCQY